jgi:hypothetical protein
VVQQVAEGGPASETVRHRWPPRMNPPPCVESPVLPRGPGFRLLFVGGGPPESDPGNDAHPPSDPCPSVVIRGRPSPRPATASRTATVRDEEAALPHGLGSVARLFDEIMVVDT